MSSTERVESFDDWQIEQIGKSVIGSVAEYELKRPLGHGAFSTAFLGEVVRVLKEEEARQMGLHAREAVVVKIPNYDSESFGFSEIRSHLERVERETRRAVEALGRLAGVPGVAQVLDRGAWDVSVQGDTLPSGFLVQEYVDGETLKAHLTTRFPATDGRFRGVPTASDFFSYAERITSILRAVHQHNVVHGDIWHQNILARNGDLVFIDFGSSVFRDRTYFDPGRTLMKSNAYIAPERLKGIRGRREGRRSDIFSLGGTLFYIASGLDPEKPDPDLDRHKLGVVRRIADRNPELLRENPGIADIVARCTRHRKDERTASADALLSEMRTFSAPAGGRASESSFACTADRIRQALDGLEHRGDSLFYALAELELSTQCGEVEDMSHGILDVCGDHEHLVSTLCRCLSILGSGDSLLVRSTPQLWYPLNLGVNGRFLSMCSLLARGGVKVVILLLLSDEDRTDPTTMDIVTAHRNAADNLKDALPNADMRVACLEVSSGDRELKLGDGWQRGVMRHAERSYTFEPILSEAGELRSIRLLSKVDPIPKTLKQFAEELAESMCLDEWLSRSV